MPAAFVQKAQTWNSTATATITATFSAGTTAGNLIVGTVTNGNTNAITAAQFSSSAGTIVIVDTDPETNGPYNTATFYIKNIAGSVTTVSFTPTAAASPQGIEIQEASGLDTVSPLDQHSLSLATSTATSISTPSVTTTAAGEYIYTTVCDTTTGFFTISGAGGSVGTFTLRNNDTVSDIGADASSIQTSAGAINGTFAVNAIQNYSTGIVTFKVASGAAAPTWGFNAAPGNERMFPIQRTDWAATTWFRPSQIPVPQRWQPTTGMEDRPPEPKKRPDDSSIEFEQWFVQSPNPVPTRWLPTTGEEDRPPPPWRRPDDSAIEEPQFFRRSPNPVPTTFLPTTGEEDRPPNPNRIRSPDEPYPWFVRSPNPVPIVWLPTTGEEDRPPNPNRIRGPDEPFVWFVRSPVPVPATWLPTTGEEDRPPNPNRIRSPDEPYSWFVRSPHPVPTICLPTTGEEDRPPALKRPPDEPGNFFFQKQVITLPTSWPVSYQEDRPPPPRSRPDDSVIEEPQWFARSPNPVPTIWLPQWDGGEKPKQIGLDPSQLVLPIFVTTPVQFACAQTNSDDFNPLKPSQWGEHPLTWDPQSFAAPVGISGIAWYTPFADKEKLPPIKRPPDESFLWFVRSPVPVPATWLPLWDGWERPKPVPPDASLTAFSFKTPAVVSTISGIAWLNLSDATGLPRIIGDPYAVQTLPFFIEPPLIPFYAAANADDFNPLPKAPPDASLTAFSFKTPVVVATPNIGWQRADVPVTQVFFYSPDTGTSWLPQPIAPPVGISGISWWRQTEVYVGPPPPQLDYIISWNPQFITPPAAGALLLRTLMGMGR